MVRSRHDWAHRIPAILTLVVGLFSLGMGMSAYHQALSSLGRYSVLASEIGTEPTSRQVSSGADHGNVNAPISLPLNAVAWVTVGNTPIDLPVAGGDRGTTWYLSHDLWNQESSLGCPFMDPRCASPEGRHVIVYGHHLSLTNAMFSPLYRCYQPNHFASLGTCTWRTPSGSVTLAPLCALSVRSDWQDIMRFSFTDEEDMRTWLGHIVKESTAQGPNASTLLSDAHRVVTLVTCSSNLSGQPWRTLVLFVA